MPAPPGGGRRGGDFSEGLGTTEDIPIAPADQDSDQPFFGPDLASKLREERGERDPPAPRDRAITATPWTWRDPAGIPPRAWLYGRHYIRKFVSVTVAPGGVGKSSLSIVEALSIAAGRDLLDHGRRIEPHRVWIWNGEDPREELDRRVAAAARHYELNAEDLADRLFVDSGRDQGMILATTTKDGTRIAEPVVEAVEAAIRNNGIDVLIVDPFVSSHQVAENDNGAVDMVAKAWAGIADRTDAAIDLVHHTRKPAAASSTEASADDARGASALGNAARSVRVLQRMTQDEAERAGVENRRSFFSVEAAKSNLAPPADLRSWRELVGVGLGNDTLDRPEDMVGVVTAWRWPDAFEGVSEADLAAVQRRIATGEFKENMQANAWAGHAVADVLGLDMSDATVRSRVRTMLKTWVKSGALTVVRRQDEYRRECPFIEVGEPVDGG